MSSDTLPGVLSVTVFDYGAGNLVSIEQALTAATVESPNDEALVGVGG